MGLFSSKKKTFVSSTVHNLAGDEEARTRVLPSIVLRSVLGGSTTSIGENIRSTLSDGSGAALDKFYKWSLDNYALGLPEANIGAPTDVERNAVMSGLAPLLDLDNNQSLFIISSAIDTVELDYWAEAWIWQNRPDLVEAEWFADFDFEADLIRINIADEPLVFITPPDDMIWAFQDQTRRLLYVGYQVLTQDPTTLEIVRSAPQLFTYRMGSGTVVFDSLWEANTPLDEFYPAVPLRINNKSIRDPGLEDMYEAAKEGFKKLTGRKIDSLLDQIEDNEQIGDIDFAFMVQGVNLSTKDKIGLEYLYKFFQNLINYQTMDQEIAEQYFEGMRNIFNENQKSYRYVLAHSKDHNVVDVQGNQVAFGSHPLFDTDDPDPANFLARRGESRLQIKSSLLPEFDIRLEWLYIAESLKVGNGKTYDGDTTRGKMKVGEYWLRSGTPLTKTITVPHSERGTVNRFVRYERVYLVHQYSAFRYRELEIVGLEHINNVYGLAFVRTTLQQALDASEKGEESGFIIPLHYPTFKDLGLVKKTQLSNVASYLVLNSYERVKIPWYASGFFKFIIIAASIALAPLSLGGSLAAGGGILGANVAIGLAIGASAASAAVVGAVANYLAAVIVSQVIQYAGRELIGGKFGAILGAIASFVALSYAGNFAQTGSFDLDWSSLMNVENIMGLTNSVSNAYSLWLQTDSATIFEEIEKVKENFEDQSERINELSEEILGMTNGLIDSMMFTNAAEYFEESRDGFLSRTLLTGSDISKLTHAMIENFSDISLELPRQI